MKQTHDDTHIPTVEILGTSKPNVLDKLKLDQALKLAKKKTNSGSIDEAKQIYQDILKKFSKNKPALMALQLLNKAKATVPNEPPLDQLQFISSLYAQGQFQQALSRASKALLNFPNSVVLCNICGNCNARLKQYDAAINSYKRALEIKPDDADAYNHMGIAQMDNGNLEAAIHSYKQALNIKPDFALAYNNMGIALKNKGDLEAAIHSYKQALNIKPNYAKACRNLGNALKDKGDLEAAIDSYKQAVTLKPDDAEAYFNLGTALSIIGDREAAIANYRQASQIKPDYAQARALKFHQQAHICDWSEIGEDQALIPELGTLAQVVTPWSMLSLEDSPERHQIRSKKYANRSHFQPLPPLTYQPAKKPQPIRVGYFSADFHNHATMLLMIKVFELHNQKEFETHAYSFGPNRGDKMRQRVIKAVDIFHDVTHMSNQEIALFSQANNIDIAVDLKGFTKDNRMSIFAYRAAPIQISHLGYPGTMGADFIDYIIADKIVIPEKFDCFYSERIIRLPHTYQPNDNTRAISKTVVTRLAMGLPERGFVFCCFNNSYKISSEEFNIWMRILSKVEGSVLWLIKANKGAVKNLKKEAQSRGVASHRLVFADKAPQDQHIARHRLADLFIDTFNCNAHTTASDALWAGLPLVTKLGQGFAARVAGSLLTAIGLPELIVENLEDYEALILDLANNPKRLTAIKEKLAANRLSKPLFDTELFTKHLEEGYQQAYQRYAQGKLPKNISVSAQLQTEA